MALEIMLHNQDLDDLLVDVRDLNLGGQFILNGFTLPQSRALQDPRAGKFQRFDGQHQVARGARE